MRKITFILIPLQDRGFSGWAPSEQESDNNREFPHGIQGPPCSPSVFLHVLCTSPPKIAKNLLGFIAGFMCFSPIRIGGDHSKVLHMHTI
jgi:hypothetical protein